MTTAGICTIGDEILIGQITDTNSAMISRELGKAGIRVTEMISIGDIRQDIAAAAETLLRKNDILIVTGGLGPTKDDVTKSVIYELSGSSSYVTDSRQLEIIHRILSSRGLDVMDINRRQADVPDKCEVIPNRLGTAPVMVARFPAGRFGHEAAMYSLPGVPFEAAGAMPDIVADIRKHFRLSEIHHKTIMTYGIAESALAEKISAWEEALPSSVRLAYLPDPLKGVSLRMSVYGQDEDAASLFAAETARLRDILGDAIYAEEEKTLPEVLGDILRSSGKTISTAESCTGGMVASLIASVPGASDYFLGSVVSYSYSVKEKALGVPREIIDRFGAVSPECAAAMADGVRKLTGADFAVATTGNAGPSASEDKELGLVWVGVSSAKGSKTMDFHYRNDRKRNMERFSASALDAVRKFILQQSNI